MIAFLFWLSSGCSGFESLLMPCIISAYAQSHTVKMFILQAKRLSNRIWKPYARYEIWKTASGFSPWSWFIESTATETLESSLHLINAEIYPSHIWRADIWYRMSNAKASCGLWLIWWDWLRFCMKAVLLFWNGENWRVLLERKILLRFSFEIVKRFNKLMRNWWHRCSVPKPAKLKTLMTPRSEFVPHLPSSFFLLSAVL